MKPESAAQPDGGPHCVALIKIAAPKQSIKFLQSSFSFVAVVFVVVIVVVLFFRPILMFI